MELKRSLARQAIDFIKKIDINDRLEEKLSPLQLRILTFIQERGCVKSMDISRDFNVTPATVTVHIDKLEKGKWLRRCSNGEDRRVTNIRLTKKAERELDEMVNKVLKKYEWLFSTLTESEQKQLHTLFVKINESVKESNERSK
jgi:DNA-binding MarR family transcriptional regulator